MVRINIYIFPVGPLLEIIIIFVSTDWRDDGWHWRQQGTSSIQCDGVTCKKMFFYTVLGTTEKEQVLSAEFKREAFHHPDYPLRVLVRYIGDSSVQVGLPRDFAKIKRNRARRAVGPDGLRTSAIYRRNEKSAISNEEFCRMIPTMESVSVPITKAMGGFYYMYEADCPSKIEGNILARIKFSYLFIKLTIVSM